MPIRIGKAPAQGDVVDALVDCHQRIRDFTSLAVRLAGSHGLAAEEIREAAAGVHRYFAVALPLHARDEEESLLPRLEGREAALDAELAEMMREHAEHGDPTGRVLAACARLEEDPSQLAALAPQLAVAARDLERHFQVHLEREERVIFPAIRRLLDAPTRERIQVEMRERRAG
jgi:hemerythrin-like domain-containing protein